MKFEIQTTDLSMVLHVHHLPQRPSLEQEVVTTAR